MSALLPVIHCVGCGRAGRSLLRLLADARLIRVGHVVNRSLASAERAVAFIGSGTPVEQLPLLNTGDGLLVGLPESELRAVAQSLAETMTEPVDFAFHLSASQPGVVLASVAKRAASLHPAMAFAEPQQAINQFAGSWCVLEGEAELCTQLRLWLKHLNAHVVVADTLDKTLYHAAAMGASNLVLATLGMAQRLAVCAGVPPESAQGLLTALALRNVEAAQERGIAEAFTGPMERGDERAVETLLSAVAKAEALPVSDRQLWQRLLQSCMPLIQEQQRLSVEQLTRLAQLLAPDGATKR